MTTPSAEYLKNYRRANKDKILEKERAYRDANREKIREKQRIYRLLNQDKIKAAQKKYREIKKDKERSRKREHRNKNLTQARLKATQANRKRGAQPRPHGEKRLTRVSVGQTRRFVFLDNRIYFNREIGFTVKELKEIIRAAILAGLPNQ